MDSEKLKKLTQQQREDYDQAEQDFDKRLKAYNRARAQKAVEPVLLRLKSLGYAPKVLSDTGGYLTVRMKPAMIKDSQTWPEIRQLMREPNFKGTSVPTTHPPSPAAPQLPCRRYP